MILLLIAILVLACLKYRRHNAEVMLEAIAPLHVIERVFAGDFQQRLEFPQVANKHVAATLPYLLVILTAFQTPRLCHVSLLVSGFPFAAQGA